MYSCVVFDNKYLMLRKHKLRPLFVYVLLFFLFMRYIFRSVLIFNKKKNFFIKCYTFHSWTHFNSIKLVISRFRFSFAFLVTINSQLKIFQKQ